MSLTNTEISKIMQWQSPMFIVGAPRSGTSILYRTLQRHSSFKPYKCQDKSGVELTESNIFKTPYSIYSGSQANAFAYMLSDEDYYSQFLTLTRSIQNYQKLLIGKEVFQKIIPFVTTNQTIRASFWKITKNDILIRTFLYYAQQARGMKRIIEKTPQHIARLPEIKATFPNAKLLFMSRHPLDVFSSYRRRFQDSLKLKMKESELKWLRLSSKEFCHKYANYMKIAFQEQAHDSSNFMLISYEDFISNTEFILHNIFEFIGESYEEECIPTDKIESISWQPDPNLFGAIKSKTKSWQDFVNESEARFIEDRLADIISKLNYPRYTK